MHKRLCSLLFPLAVVLPCQASIVPLHVEVAGQAQAVEVLDPDIPVLRFYGEWFGNSNLNLVSYVMTFMMNVTAGEGMGKSSFVADDGDTLLGDLTIRFTPSSQAGVFQIEGVTQFIGGTGLYEGATGNASFSGLGQFTSGVAFKSTLIHDGVVNLVPEPPALALALLSLAAMGAVQASRRR